VICGLAFSCLSVSSCSSDCCSVEVNEAFEPGNTETSMARLEISGMHCAQSCGGKIKKELLELSGVANANIEFESGRSLNAAEVEFDPEKVSPDELATAVSGIADGKLYEVKSVEVTHFAKEGSIQ
jgi:copper chaperone CopZ